MLIKPHKGEKERRANCPAFLFFPQYRFLNFNV